MGEKSRGLLSSVIMTVLVAALPHRHSFAQENSKMFFHLDGQQEKNKNELQRKRRKPSRSAECHVGDFQLVDACLQSFLSHFASGNIISSQNLRSTDTTEEGEPIHKTPTATAFEAKKLVYRGRFSSLLPYKLTSLLARTVNHLSSFIIPTNVVCSHYLVNAFESMVKEHFLLHAKPTKTDQPTCLSEVITSASHMQEDLKAQLFHNFLLSCTVYFDPDLNQIDLKLISTRIFSALSFHDVTTYSDQRNSPPVTTCLSLRVLPSSLCIDQAIEPEAQSELTEFCLSKDTDTKKCAPSDINLSNEPISSVKVISPASEMALNDQISNMEGFSIEVEDIFEGFGEVQIVRSVVEVEEERLREVQLARGGGENDYDDDDIDPMGESQDSDSLYESDSNPTVQGNPGRSPSPVVQNPCPSELAEHSRTIFDLRETSWLPLEEGSEESDQSVPNSIAA